MSETKSLAAPKAAFDRRSVVKAGAWSVPVIAAAIAAPAAAASTPAPATVSGSIVGAGSAQVVSGTPEVLGHGPQGFAISTTGTTGITGTVSVSVTVAPANQATIDSKIGLVIGTINNKALTGGTWSGNVTVPPKGTSPTFTFGAYSRTGTGSAPNGVTLSYVITLSITVIDSAANKSTVLAPIQTTATLTKK